MLKNRLKRSILVLMLVPLFACGDGGTEPEPDPVVTGTWQGNVQLGGPPVTMRMTLVEGESGAVTGNGTLNAGTQQLPLTVESGTHQPPGVTLNLGATGFESMEFTGEFDGEDAIAGTLRGSGFSGETLNLFRVETS